jgi:hypothetical protein
MTERSELIAIHFCLLLLQIVCAGMAIGVSPSFAGLAPVIGGAQGFFPNPFKETTK